MSWTIWIMAAIILLVIEIITPGVFFFACLSLGALFAGLAEFFNPPVWVPTLVFIVTSVLSIYFIRPFAIRVFQTERKKSNVDALIGQKALVIEPIDPPKIGMVKVEGELWQAKSDEKIESDEYAEIVSIQGTHLKVKKQESRE